MKTFDDYKKLFDLEGIELLFKKEDFSSTQNKYRYKCSKGHTWEARFKDIVGRGLKRESKGCPNCAKDISNKISEKAVEKNLIDGHIILDYQLKFTEKNSNRKERFYKVQCPYNHIYEKRSSKLKEGCPSCSNGVFVGEERVRIILKTHFRKEFKKIRPEWLINHNTNSKMELDGYNEELKIAFEYQGRQHYSNNTQFAGTQKEQEERDQLKKKLCEANNIKLYVLDQPSSYAEDKFVESILAQFKKQGLEISSNMKFCFQELTQDISLQKKFQEFQSFVEEQDIILISKNLSTMEDELDFQCKEGHFFKMNGLKFKEIVAGKKYRNYICIDCNGSVREDINLKSIKDFAKSIDYTLLTNNYTNVNEPMDWICNNGHRITKNYRSFQRNKTGNYCDVCVKLSGNKLSNSVKTQFKTISGESIDLNTVLNFAKSINYQLVSKRYNNVNEKMNWICNNGHEVHKSYRQFQRNRTGNYCDECLKNTPSLRKHNGEKTQFKSKNGEVIDLNSIKGFAESIGFKLITNTYRNVNEKMHWVCNNGHDIHKSYRQFQRNKTGNYCDECKKVN